MMKQHIFLMALWGTFASANTLEIIKNNQEIILGYEANGFPFSYLIEGENQPNGYSHDVALFISKKLQEQFNLPQLTVKYQLVKNADRFNFVNDGTVHLHCAYTANTKSSQEKANFSVNFFLSEIRFVVHKNSGMTSYADIKGKTIATTKGTMAEKFISSRKPNLKYQSIVYTKGFTESIGLLRKREVDAVLTDDLLGLGYAMYADDNPDDYELVGGTIQKKHYSCLMKKGDDEFKKAVDKILIAGLKSGELEKVYNKWFLNPIPPKNINLNIPMSDNVHQIFSYPSDLPPNKE